MLDKILVPIDSIEWDNTLSGVENAMEIARGCQVDGEPELIFLHVFHFKSRVPMSEKERLKKLKKKKFENEYETIKEMCEEKGLKNYRKITAEGNPQEEILETAANENVDLIVMGSGKLHDRSAKGKFDKFIYGSVTEEVTHESPCSILVARPIES